jgi:hypothetical protein
MSIFFNISMKILTVELVILFLGVGSIVLLIPMSLLGIEFSY